VRVGTENRQHVLGHISLLGYRGRIIAPMTTGRIDESALGDPLEILLTEWARQCKARGGLVVLPHFPNPRAEHAASIISGDIDALEMTAWGDLYSGIDPYSLSDWYRYLNCGYRVAAVGGTDKMWSSTAVGAVRTYARLAAGPALHVRELDGGGPAGRDFRHLWPVAGLRWMAKRWAARLQCRQGGGTLDVTWQVATVTVPVRQVDLIVNGEVRESALIDGEPGCWKLVRTDRARFVAGAARARWLCRQA
jgi:hypothetical protein